MFKPTSYDTKVLRVLFIGTVLRMILTSIALFTEEEMQEAVKKESENMAALKKPSEDSSRWQVMVEQKRMPPENDGKYSVI